MQSEVPRFTIRISPLTVKETLFNSLIKDIDPYSFKIASCLFDLIACFRSLNTFCVFADCHIILNMQSFPFYYTRSALSYSNCIVALLSFRLSWSRREKL